MVHFRPSILQRSDKHKAQLRLVVPVSGGGSDRRVIEVACRIGRTCHPELTLIYVVEVQQSMPLDAELPEEFNRGEGVLRDAALIAAEFVKSEHGQVFTELLQARSAGAAIVDEALDRHADAVVLGASVGRRYGRLTTGDTVDYVLKNAPCEVLLVRHHLPDAITETMEWS